MFEHVGKRYYDAFFRNAMTCWLMMGIILLHTVGRWNGPSDTNAWVWRYMFPGGYTPALSELAPAIERSGLTTSDIEVLRIHYAETLRAWRSNLLVKRKEVIRLFEEDPILKTRFGGADRFIRMWNTILPGLKLHLGPTDLRFRNPADQKYRCRPADPGLHVQERGRTDFKLEDHCGGGAMTNEFRGACINHDCISAAHPSHGDEPSRRTPGRQQSRMALVNCPRRPRTRMFRNGCPLFSPP